MLRSRRRCAVNHDAEACCSDMGLPSNTSSNCHAHRFSRLRTLYLVICRCCGPQRRSLAVRRGRGRRCGKGGLPEKMRAQRGRPQQVRVTVDAILLSSRSYLKSLVVGHGQKAPASPGAARSHMGQMCNRKGRAVLQAAPGHQELPPGGSAGGTAPPPVPRRAACSPRTGNNPPDPPP